MECKLCGKEASYFGSKNCDNSHRVHKACLEKIGVKFKSFEDCRSCIKKFLMNFKQSSICFKCSSDIVLTKSHCMKYKNLCAKCIPKFIERHHYDKCKNCKALCANLVFPCNSCKEFSIPGDLLKIPRCINHHKYCKICIKNIKAPCLTIKNCTPCLLYFNMLEKFDNKNEVICNLCGRFPEGTSFFCEFNHIYCKICMVFLKSEPFTEYPRVFRCRSCIEFIQTLSIGPNGPVIPKKIEETKYQSLTEKKVNGIISESLSYDNFERTEKNDMETEYSDATIKLGNTPGADNEIDINENSGKNLLFNNNCSFCEKKSDFVNACGHFFCMPCLSEYAKQYIYYIIINIVNCSDPQKIKSIFILPCCYANCGKKIALPLNMVLSEMTIGPKTEYSDLIYQFNPYLEGMRAKFIRCTCNSIVGIIGSVRMNCRCSRLDL